MSNRDKLKKKAAIDAAKSKKRLTFSIIGLMVCIAVLIQLNSSASVSDTDATEQDKPLIDIEALLPIFDADLLATIKDSTDAERVMLEPEAFATTLYNSGALLSSWVFLLGEPEYDFVNGANDPSPHRGKVFRARGEILDARNIIRVISEPAEYWTLLKTENGDSMFFVAAQAPETLFGADNFVLADGYFYKNYRQRINGNWITAPLFVGNKLEPSVPAEPPLTQPDMRMLNKLKDQPIGTDNNTLELDKLKEMWHLANVAREMKRNPERAAKANEEAILLDFATLTDLVKNPELYRGQIFEIGGEVVEAHAVRTGENSLRSREISSGWLRNSFLGDTLLHVKAADDFALDAFQGNSIMHGYFLMLWAYVDRQGAARRVPVFVVYDSREQETLMPDDANPLIFAFLGSIMVLGLILFFAVRRENRQRNEAMRALAARQRRREQRNADKG
ncbi:hypothetical protein N9C81_01300 [Planctomycetota bacterium]|nr:hypothetical protein [Planctomycetota bacterium]